MQSTVTGLEITAGQRTMSGLIGALTGQTFDLPVMLTGQIRSYQNILKFPRYSPINYEYAHGLIVEL